MKTTECEYYVPNSKEYPCYDCGSTIELHHTTTCCMSYSDEIKDLPEIPNTQWWNKSVPDHLK